MHYKNILTFFCLSYFFVLLSQENKYLFDKVHFGEIMEGNYPRIVRMDNYGFLWVAINNGVIKYDGISSKHYEPEKNGRTSFLFEDSDSDIWITTDYKKVFYLNRKLEQFSEIVLPDTIQLLNALTEDNDGNIIIAADYNLYKYNKKTAKIQKKSLKIYPRTLMRDSKGIIWIGSLDGLYQYITNSDSTVVKKFNYGQGDDILCIEREADTLWVGSVFHFKKFLIKNNNVSLLKTYINNDVIFSTSKTPFGSRFVGGLQYFYELKDDKINKLSEFRSVRDLYYKNGKLWISSRAFEEILKIDKSKNYFKKSTITSGAVKQFYKDSKKRIWIIHHNGISLLSNENEHENLKTVANLNVYRVMEIDGEIYFTSGYGLYKYDSKSNKVIKISKENLTCSYIADYNEDYIIASYRFSDIYLIHKKNLTEKAIYEKGAQSSYFEEVHQSKDNDFWFISNNGLRKLDKENNVSFVSYIEEEQKNNFITAYIDKQNNMWLGNIKKEVIIYNISKNHFTDLSGLYKDLQLKSLIIDFAEDKDENIWFITRKKLFKLTIKRDSNSVGIERIQYYENHNIKNLLFLTIDQDNIIHFGGNDGFISFNPRDLKENTISKTAEITNIKVFDKSLEVLPDSIDTDIPHLEQSLIFTDKLQFSHDDNNITIELSALDYTEPGKNKFKYKLEPIEKSWTYLTTKNTVTYSKLKPGDYHFVVKSANSDGIWSKESRKLAIIINRPIWQKWWFILILLFSLFLLVYVIIKWKILKIAKEKDALEEIILERTRELDQKNKQLIEFDQIKNRFFYKYFTRI